MAGKRRRSLAERIEARVEVRRRKLARLGKPREQENLSYPDMVRERANESLPAAEVRRRSEKLRVQIRREQALAGERCINCSQPPLPGKTKCLHHYVRQLLHGAARVNTSASLPGAPPAFNVDDAAVEWALEQFEAQQRRCYLSGIELVIGENACLDHVLSRARYRHHHLAGGLENLRWADHDVNRAKGQLTPEQFLSLCQKVVDHNTSGPRTDRQFWGAARGVSLLAQGKGEWAYLRATLPQSQVVAG